MASFNDISSMPTAIIIGIAILAYAYYYKNSSANVAPLPPGPKGYPIIGCLLDMPTNGFEWLSYERWGEQYGTI